MTENNESLKLNSEGGQQESNNKQEASFSTTNTEHNKIEADKQFDLFWERYGMDNYFNKNQKVYLKALQSPEDFAKLIEHETNDYKLKHKLDVSSNLKEQDYQKISDEIREQLVLVFSIVFRKVSEGAAKEFFQEIMQMGYMESPTVMMTLVLNKLDSLITKSNEEYINGANLRSILEFQFFRKTFVNKVVDREEEVGKNKKINHIIEPVALTKFEQCSFTDYLRSIRKEMEHEAEWTEYTHNVGSLMMHSAGEKGFWSQFAHYADKMGATDIDGIMDLPDNQVILAAYELYTKFIQGEFAKYNFVHQPNMFSADAHSNFSILQQKVKDNLKLMFPHLTDKEEYRIFRAMTMGLGLARGVFLTEQELAAWADPNLKLESGKPTYKSYYTNDNAALNPLNPLHHFLRWQSDGVIRGPLLFSIVSGIEPKFINNWDHKKLWEQMKKAEEAWNKGEVVLENKDTKTFMDILTNIARVGSMVTRAGWSLLPEIEAYFVHKKTESQGNIQREKSALDNLNTFKSIEYIGFDAVFAFVKDYIQTDGFILANNALLKCLSQAKGKDLTERLNNVLDMSLKGDLLTESAKKTLEERDQLLSYIYQQYFLEAEAQEAFKKLTPEKQREQVYTTIKGLMKSSEEEIEKLIKQKKLQEAVIVVEVDNQEVMYSKKEAAILTEMFKKFIARGMVGILEKRIPSKFLVLDRSRNSKDGIRVWEKIARQLQKEEGLNHLPLNQIMDQRLQDLMLVETILRKETTEKMKAFQREYFNNNKCDFSNFTCDYVINEQVIKHKLSLLLAEKDVQLYNALKQNDNLSLEDALRSIYQSEGKNQEEIDQIIAKDERVLRIRRSGALYKAIKEHIHKDNDQFLLAVAEKIRPTNALGQLNDLYFPFSIAPEELENSLLAWRASGEKVLKRRLGDIASVETEVFANLTKFISLLPQVATDGKHDFKPLVEVIKKIQTFLQGAHGKEYSYKVAYHLSLMAISYFRKDAVADNLLTKIFSIGRANSLAAEYAGFGVPVWEFGIKEVDGFINALVLAEALPRHPYETTKTKPDIEKRAFSLLGKKLFTYMVRKPDYEYYEGKLRKSVGATLKQLAVFELAGNTLPVLIILLIFLALKKGLDELGGGKK